MARPRATSQDDVSAAEVSFLHQLADDTTRRRVDWYREAEADAGNGGVDPDDASPPVCESATGVARIESGIRLDHVLDNARRGARPRWQRAVEGGDDAGSDRAREAVRIPDRDHKLADAKRLGVAELGRNEVA